MKVLAVGGSVRATHPESRTALLKVVNTAHHLEQFRSSVSQLIQAQETNGARPLLSNTEILCGAALLGARVGGASVDYFPLTRLFPRGEQPRHSWKTRAAGLEDEVLFWDTSRLDQAKLEELAQRLQEADAVLLSSPVYFGDRSSVLSRFFQWTALGNKLANKMVAALSAGAKRNGGQETTNIYLLHEASLQGAWVVGNGPPNSQYGGTAQAGDRGELVHDQAGLRTGFDTGNRLIQAAALVRPIDAGEKDEAVNLVVLVTMDLPGHRLLHRLQERVRAAQSGTPSLNVTLLSLMEEKIERCLACDICPVPELLTESQDYACIIQTARDPMEALRAPLLNADAILLAGLDVDNQREVVNRYQVFTERTRFIRRNDFELTNVPLSAFCLRDATANQNPLFSLKVLTSYIRQNCIVCPALDEVDWQGSALKNAEGQFRHFVRVAQRVKRNRRLMEKVKVSYKAEGYRDRRLDATESFR